MISVIIIVYFPSALSISRARPPFSSFLHLNFLIFGCPLPPLFLTLSHASVLSIANSFHCSQSRILLFVLSCLLLLFRKYALSCPLPSSFVLFSCNLPLSFSITLPLTHLVISSHSSARSLKFLIFLLFSSVQFMFTLHSLSSP